MSKADAGQPAEMALHCPRCGDRLEPLRDEIMCRRGDMELSRVLRLGLEEVVEVPAGRPDASAIRWGGAWHCPADGEAMVEEDGVIQCVACGRFLPGRLLYQLIEFHSHKKERP